MNKKNGGEVLGICGFAIPSDKVRIRIISVEENARSRGVGSAMVAALQKLYSKDIEADTNDDAVGFYRKKPTHRSSMRKLKK